MSRQSMGLYQYIREQSHRKDLVGELGSWMSSNYGERPDHNSLAFELAAKEFTACGNWTRQNKLDQLNGNKKLQEILKAEPRLSEIISEAISLRAHQGYNRINEYHNLKMRVSSLVGYDAEKEEVSNSATYDVVIQAINDLLPPDAQDLYKDGLPEGVHLDL